MLADHVFSELHQPEAFQAHFDVKAGLVDCRSAVHQDCDFLGAMGEAHFACLPCAAREVMDGPVVRQILRSLRGTVLFEIGDRRTGHPAKPTERARNER